ncbi:reverse transcriptase domain-containing protein [Tanacetum coccineum]
MEEIDIKACIMLEGGFRLRNVYPRMVVEILEVYRVKLWKDIQNAHQHYMAKLNQVLDPLLTSKDAPEQVKVPVQLLLIFAKVFSSSKKTGPKNVSLDQLIGMDTAISPMRKADKALDDVIDMGRRLDAFTKSVKVRGAGKKPILVSRLIKIIIEYWMVNLKWDLKQILKRLQGSAEYDRMNVKVPSGILIHGPNRTGKSSLVHAFAREAKLPFFAVQGKEIEKNPPMIVSLFSEARVSSPSIIYIEGIEVITSTGVSQILDQMESCENDGAAIVVIGTADNVKTLVKDIKDGFDMLVHLGKPDMVSRTKMVDGLMKDYVVLEDRDKICNYIASGTSSMVWKNIKAILSSCIALVVASTSSLGILVTFCEFKWAGGIPPRVNSSRSVSVLDAFSSISTPDYTPTSPDYSPATPGNTSSDPSKDSSKDRLASLAISPFHDDPYMKVMQAYNATTCFLSSSSTDSSAPPRVFETGESSYVTRLERHDEHIETILNHLDESPLERIEQVEENIECLVDGRREKMGHNNEIVLARIMISTLEIIIEDIQVRHQADMKSLLDKIRDLKNHKGGSPRY